MKPKRADKIKTKKQLLKELHRMIHTEGEYYHSQKVVFLGLAYLINELVPDDRRTAHVFEAVLG